MFNTNNLNLYLNDFDKNFIIDILKTTTGINTFLVKDGFQNLNMIDNNLRSSIFVDSNYFLEAIKDLLRQIKDNTVYKIIDNFDLQYIFIKIPYVDEYFIISPFIGYTVDKNEIANILKKNGIGNEYLDSFHNFYSSVPVIQETLSTSILNNIAKYIYRSEIAYKVDIFDGSFQSIHSKDITLKEQADMELYMNLTEYNLEKKNELLNSIKKGDRRKALIILPEIFSNTFKPSINKNIESIRERSNMLNILYKNSVEETAVHPVYIDTLYKKYNNIIYKEKNSIRFNKIMTDMTREYCDLVIAKSLANYAPIIRNSINYIYLNIERKISLNDIAIFLDINPSYLSNYFKQEMNMTLTDFINNVKIQEAIKLLKNNDLQIQDIAYQVGFYDVNYFTKIFKKITNFTPSEYRKNRF